jgi:putative methyltransferase (TIGR04325 family)
MRKQNKTKKKQLTDSKQHQQYLNSNLKNNSTTESNTLKPFSVWSGVYQNFTEVESNQELFQSKAWLQPQLAKIQTEVALLKQNPELAATSASKEYPLTTVVSLLVTQQEKLTIVDFGGGFGWEFLALKQKLPNHFDKINFHLIDNENIIAAIPTEIAELLNFSCAPCLSPIARAVDIVHFGSSMQYIDQWQELLTSMVKLYQPKFLIFSDLLAGDIPDFVTAQHYYGEQLAIRMYNLPKFIEFLDCLNYDLNYQALYHNKILDSDTLPNSELPTEYQLKHTCNLIFYKQNYDTSK